MNAVVPSAVRAPSLYALQLREFTAELRKSWRQPAFAVPTLVLPLAFYSLFGVVLSRPGTGGAGYLLATYGVFAALGPSLFGFGAGIAAERENGTLALKQIAPLPASAFLGAKLLACLTFTLCVVVALYAIAALAGGVALPRAGWAALAAVHLCSVPPFCLLGLCVGLRFGAPGAMAVTNVAFMLLAVLGGLWIPLFLFPASLQAVAQLLPSHHLAQLALLATGRDVAGSALLHVAALAVFTLTCALLARALWNRGAR